MIGGGLAEVLAWLATAELTGDVSEVHIDTFTYELIVFELVQYGHPGVKWSTRRRNTSPVNVLGTAHTNLNEQMVVTMAQWAGLKVEVRKHGKHLYKQFMNCIVVRHLAGISECRDVIACLGIREGCDGSIGVVTIFCIDMYSNCRFSGLAKSGF